eukprot:Lankesteria_metandrocarpae@DN8360_c0_g1_i1.p1
MKLIVEEKFSVPPRILYAVFLDQKAWTGIGMGAKAEMDPRPDTAFSLFDGGVTGTVKSFKVDKEVQFTWRFNTWKTEDVSLVTISFEPFGVDCTKITVLHTDVPLTDKFGTECEKQVIAGWKDTVFGRIEMVMGFPRYRE